MNDREADETTENLSTSALKTLAEVHESFLQFLRRRLRSHEDAEDVMQDVYLRVLEHGSELRNEEGVRAWLHRVLQSALVDHFRRTAVRQRIEADFARKEDASPPLEEDIDAIVCLCLYKLLPLLRPEYAEVLRRVELSSESHEVAAAALGLTLGNLNVRLHRARQALRRALQLSCRTCPIHGYLDCGCDYTKRLRSQRAHGIGVPM